MVIPVSNPWREAIEGSVRWRNPPDTLWFPILGGRLLKIKKSRAGIRRPVVSNPWREAIEGIRSVINYITKKFPILGGRLLKASKLLCYNRTTVFPILGGRLLKECAGTDSL